MMIEVTYKDGKLKRYPPKDWRWVSREEKLKAMNMEDVQTGDTVIEMGTEYVVESVKVVPLEM